MQLSVPSGTPSPSVSTTASAGETAAKKVMRRRAASRILLGVLDRQAADFSGVRQMADLTWSVAEGAREQRDLDMDEHVLQRADLGGAPGDHPLRDDLVGRADPRQVQVVGQLREAGQRLDDLARQLGELAVDGAAALERLRAGRGDLDEERAGEGGLVGQGAQVRARA